MCIGEHIERFTDPQLKSTPQETFLKSIHDMGIFPTAN